MAKPGSRALDQIAPLSDDDLRSLIVETQVCRGAMLARLRPEGMMERPQNVKMAKFASALGSAFASSSHPWLRTVFHRPAAQHVGEAPVQPGFASSYVSIYTHVISEDGKRVAAQLGNAIWGILDPNGPRKENGSGVEPPKPLSIN